MFFLIVNSYKCEYYQLKKCTNLLLSCYQFGISFYKIKLQTSHLQYFKINFNQ